MKLRLNFEQKKSARPFFWGALLFRALARELLLFKFYMLTYNGVIFAKKHFFLFLLWIASGSVEETSARSAY
jgi:hypothetical protein